jgi:protein TonB
MQVLSALDESLGPGSEARPIFQMNPATPSPGPNTPLVNAIREGRYDGLFAKDSGVSTIVHEAGLPPPPPPSVVIEGVTPSLPVSPELPRYPPIARVAHVEGLVQATFAVSADGKVQNIVFVSEPRLKMLELAVSEAVSKWNFPQSAWGKSGSVTIRFALNC